MCKMSEISLKKIVKNLNDLNELFLYILNLFLIFLFLKMS
jgi:hypothetical protein